MLQNSGKAPSVVPPPRGWMLTDIAGIPKRISPHPACVNRSERSTEPVKTRIHLVALRIRGYNPPRSTFQTLFVV
jgi:hypothetical protein